MPIAAHHPSTLVRHAAGLSCLVALLACGSTASARAPTLDHLFPAGASRGTTVEVAATGQFERWPVRGWASAPGIAVTAGTEKGKLSVTVAADAPPGVHWLRLFDDEGVTNPRPFFVGILPELAEVEPNDEPDHAHRVELGATTINGRLAKNGDVDGFVVRLAKGQTLVAAMEANRRLGSPMDGVLQVATPGGFVLAQNDDDHDRDPQIVFEAPAEGDYVVRTFAFPFVQESAIRFSGAPTYIYRLTLTSGGLVDHTYPMAVSETGPRSVEAVGWNIPESARRLDAESPGLADEGGPIRVVHPLLANLAEVQVVPGPSIVEVEPNDPSHAQAIALPITVSGRIDPPRDVDTYRFDARKGEVLVFRVESRSLGQPLDAVLRIADASGAVLADVDDVRKGFDPETRFTAPADGTYRATVRDLNGQGGPRYAYLLEAGPPRADFALTLPADRFDLTPGKPTEIAVTVDRREGFADAIEIGLDGHFDGVIAPTVTSAPSGPSARTVTLRLTPCDCARPGAIRIVGKSGDGRRRAASATVAGVPGPIDWAWLSVPKPTPKPDPPAQPAK